MPNNFLKRFLDQVSGEQPIKIGVITTQAGPLDYYGTMQVRGLELGIEYATQGSWQVGESSIEIVVEDDAGDPATGVRKARELIEQQGVDILQGGVSSATAILLAGVAEEYRRVLIVEPAAADSDRSEPRSSA